jgi:hypothetical protein
MEAVDVNQVYIEASIDEQKGCPKAQGQPFCVAIFTQLSDKSHSKLPSEQALY